MEDEDLNIAVGDKLEQEGNNLEDEYGYEDEEFAGQEEEDNNNNNQKENEEEDEDDDEDEAEGEGEEEEDEEEDEQNEQEESGSNEENDNEENRNEYDFGGEESPQRTGGRVRVSKKIKSGSASDDNDDEEDDQDEDDEENDELDNNINEQQMEQEGSRGKVMSRQVGKRGRETRMTSSPTQDIKTSKLTEQDQEDENGNDADQDEEIENEDGDDDEEDDDMEDSKNQQKNSGSQNENDQDNEGEENNNQQNSTGSLKDKRRKNEFWKYRYKNKEEHLRQPSQRVGLTQASNQIGAGIQGSLIAKANEQTPAANNLINNSSHMARHTANSTVKLSSFDEEESLKYALERAAKFNLEILSQKMRVQEILKFHEKNKQQQSRPILLEHWSSTTLFPSNVPVEAITEEGCKYLLNVPAFCQKSTLEDFVHKNVQQEHTDMLADLQKFGIKKQPLPKNKNIKKKLTKKSTFGADLNN